MGDRHPAIVLALDEVTEAYLWVRWRTLGQRLMGLSPALFRAQLESLEVLVEILHGYRLLR